GYERDRIESVRPDGAVYGLTVQWRPTPRTRLDGTWEHRFFGNAYHFAFDHRMRRTTFSVSASRDLTSYPQQLATLVAGGSSSELLDNLFRASVPDAAERARFVDAFIASRGLPGTLAEPLALFSQQLTLQENLRASIALTGARNTVVMSIFRLENESLRQVEETLPVAPGAFGRVVQTGVDVSWSRSLTPTTSFTLTGIATRSRSDQVTTSESDNHAVRVTLTRVISPRTHVYAGARYQRQDGNEVDFSEFAAFVGMRYTFR
ncbi:MAG TPA: TIGR03016 family PEP-CTERM system-associated outer membrane protein, partial [Casimicrobiaceae bacterium]|nr:TIGR03016 family PEP-CTERM system-associated outer membrane protein [Casimicrobiaceae bacterium]